MKDISLEIQQIRIHVHNISLKLNLNLGRINLYLNLL